MDNSNGRVNGRPDSYREVARRQYASVVAVACQWHKTVDEVLEHPTLSKFAIAHSIECSRQGIPLSPDVSLELPRRIVAVNGTNH